MSAAVKLRSRRRARGLTLVELLIAMAILALITMLIYSAIDGMRRSREGVRRISDRYREGRIAMNRVARELQSAYLSEHAPINPAMQVVKTAFIGKPGSPASRLDFNSFAHDRLERDSHESDQMEVSYFGSDDPEHDGVTDLARRMSSRLDDDPQRGGRVDVLATDIDLFKLEYLDPMSGMWRDEWDSTSVIGEAARLPLQVKVTLVLKGGERRNEGSSLGTVRLVSKVPLPIQNILNFAMK
jgi:general secretion pathway protein J